MHRVLTSALFRVQRQSLLRRLAVLPGVGLLALGLGLAPAMAADQQFVVRPQAKTAVRFTSDAPLELIQGETGQVTGTVIADPTAPEKLGKIEFKVNLAAIDTGIPLRNEHMRTQYLETQQYPYAQFKVTQLTPQFKGEVKPGQVMSYLAKGPFTLHGKTVQKTIPVTVTNQPGGTIRIQSQFPVKLEEFGIARPEIAMQKIAETLFIHLDMTGKGVVSKALAPTTPARTKSILGTAKPTAVK
jgi:polyisoprenoid-binding protein YceI